MSSGTTTREKLLHHTSPPHHSAPTVHEHGSRGTSGTKPYTRASTSHGLVLKISGGLPRHGPPWHGPPSARNRGRTCACTSKTRCSSSDLDTEKKEWRFGRSDVKHLRGQKVCATWCKGTTQQRLVDAIHERRRFARHWVAAPARLVPVRVATPPTKIT